MAAEPCSAAIFMGAISEGSCGEAAEGISELPAGTGSLSDWQLCLFFYSAVSPNSALAKADSGTKTEVSHGESENQGASSGCLRTRTGVSRRGEAVNLQRAPKPRLYPWDNSVFAPESWVRGALLQEETRFLSNIRRIPKNPCLPICCRAGLL